MSGRPATAAIRQVPLLIVPPTINKFYIIDLAPGRSMAEYLIGSGQQVFMISWRNPDARHAKWGFDTYGQAILDAMDAMDAVERITRSEQVALMGTCSGGIIAAMVAAHLAHTGRLDQIAAFTLMVTVLDESRAAWVPPSSTSGTRGWPPPRPGPAATAERACHLSRLPPRAGHGRRTHGHRSWRHSSPPTGTQGDIRHQHASRGVAGNGLILGRAITGIGALS